MKKYEIVRENVMSAVGRVTVAVYAKDSTDKQTLSTVLYDGKSQLVSGISTQMTYRPGSGLALEDAVKNIIARTITKYETTQRLLRGHIDYAQAYAELKSANVLHQLCPVGWRAESTRRAALTYYERRSIPLIQHILNRMGDPLALPEAQQEYLALARSRTDRGEANAIETANAHINAANLLYEASRHLLPQYDLPPIEIPLFRTEGIVPPEQAKAFPRDDLARHDSKYVIPACPLLITGQQTFQRYGASYINAWRDCLAQGCPAERLADSAYVVSQDAVGQKAISPGELSNYIRSTVGAYTIGYAGRIKLEGMASAMGVQLLRNTRGRHLVEDCGLRDEPGALAFLMHQSMTGQVQSDR